VVRSHRPVRVWWTFGLWRACACGNLRPCMPPDLRVRDAVGERLPDGFTVPWPVNQRWVARRSEPSRSRRWLSWHQAPPAGYAGDRWSR
jgi:hypothetical protein